MARRIDTTEARSKLAPSRSPYWIRLHSGCHLGFRKMSAGSKGTWLLRSYDPSTQKDTWKSLGAFDQMPERDRYSAAKTAAEALHKHLSGGGMAETITVAQACERYLAHLKAEGRASTAEDAVGRFRRLVIGTSLAKVPMQSLTERQTRAWRQALIARPVDGAAGEARQRSPASVNRDMAALRAALNLALADGACQDDAGWRKALEPLEGANGRRETYLDQAQRSALIAAASAEIQPFLTGMALLPLRPGALAALKVGHIDVRLSTLKVGGDKEAAGRSIQLPPDTMAFFAEQANGKAPDAPLLARADGRAWDKDAWKRPVKAAAVAAELGAEVTAYSLRHSCITDLVASGLDVLTVARLSGTSVQMIEKHYGHLRAHHGAAALATLKG